MCVTQKRVGEIISLAIEKNENSQIYVTVNLKAVFAVHELN